MRFLRAVALAAALAVPLPAVAQNAPVRTQQGIRINFQDADLSYVLTVLAQSAGINISLSSIPALTVTMRSVRDVPVADIRGLINNLAVANNISITETNGFLYLRGMLGQQAPDSRQLFIYRLRHARAPLLAQTLAALFGSGAGGVRAPTSQTLSQQLQQMQQPGQQRPIAQQVIVNNPAALIGIVQIVPDDATNSLLVRATPNDYSVIEDAIQALDLRPLQVVIEVIIAEVRRRDDLDVGVNARAIDTRSRPGNETSGEITNTEPPSNFSLRIVRTGTINVEATLSALASNGTVRILSRPVIQAQNNQEAQISVGEQRPFVSVQRSLPTNDPVRDQVVQYRDVANTLTITPTINPDGYINMAVTQDINTATNEVQFDAPIISTRSAQTQILARSGQTVVIGGLIDRQQERNRSGVPYLSRIPLIGALFGRTQNTTVNSELFLFLTPHLVQSDADADRVRQEIEQNAELLQRLAPIPPLIRPILRDTTPQPVRKDSIPSKGSRN